MHHISLGHHAPYIDNLERCKRRAAILTYTALLLLNANLQEMQKLPMMFISSKFSPYEAQLLYLRDAINNAVIFLFGDVKVIQNVYMKISVARFLQ